MICVNDAARPGRHKARMWTYHPALLATSVPRYTSYPTAAEFHDQVSANDMAGALDTIADDTPLSLYLHIPFCREICWYCGCNTGAANRTNRVQAYLDSLEAEVAMVAARLGGRGRVDRVAFGGGSPNAIPPEAFDRLLGGVKTAFGCDDPVVSVEIDPRIFDASWAEALQRNGVTRVSLGVQTFDAGIQAAIGRVQPRAMVADAMTMLRAAGVGSINFDLMYGLPGQTAEMLRETLEAAIAMAPDRLAVFGYAHVPQMIPRQRRIDASALPGSAERFAQAALAHDVLTAAGYVAIGFDHFARADDGIAKAAAQGNLKRNFQGFTEDAADVLIGLGATAISAFPDRMLQNAKNTGHYRAAIAAGQFPIERGLLRSADDRQRGDAIEAILSHGRADLGGFADLTDIKTRMWRFEALDLVRWRGDSLELTRAALPYARSIASILDRYRAPAEQRFSVAI